MQAVENLIHLTETVKFHLEQLNSSNPDNNYLKYVEQTKHLEFNVGKKLFLEITVINKDTIRFLYNWLYQKDEKGNSLEFFGSTLDEISFAKTEYDFKSKLIEFINKN